jgi:hypothetical protein
VDKWCDGGGKIVGNGAGYIWYSSIAIAYACNYSGNQQGCTSSEYNTMSQLVDVACGSSTVGWVGINDW